jgi:hypothetical protein
MARWLVGFLAIALVIGPPAGAQDRPLAPVPPGGQRVVPFFDGWYENQDGSITMSFGYSNLNRQEVVEIPIGPDNFIEPKEYNGPQPTSFPPLVAEPLPGAPAGAAGRGDRRDRERGVFTVTVPAGFQGDVVWTLRLRGETYKVPARAKTGAYRLRWPMAMGSRPPLLRFSQNGPAGRGPSGIKGNALKATVGTPLSVTVWTVDDSEREKETVQIAERGGGPKSAINVNWYKHSGPGAVTFKPAKVPLPETSGTATTAVTFAQPGEYVIRVRSDIFGRVDTSAGNQCCWTNGYLPVTVTGGTSGQ